VGPGGFCREGKYKLCREVIFFMAIDAVAAGKVIQKGKVRGIKHV
jgi:hypothetical protein